MIVANAKRVLDPTGTTMLRKGYAAKVSSKYNKLSALVRRSIVVEDCFGLAANPLRLHAATPVRAFAFTSNPEKVKGFMGWLKTEQDTLRLPLATSEPGTTAWANTYVQSGYRKGVVDGFFAAKREGLIKAAPFNEMTGSQFNEWVTKSFASPVSANRLGILYSRNFEGLKNITTEMDTQITQVLSQGLIDGENPIALARKMQKTITGMGRNRARMLARTEIINAHAEGSLDSMQQMGIENVQVFVEWSTAGDDRVCELCNQFSNTMFTIEHARGKIPYHPNCRCAWLPVPSKPKHALKQMLKPHTPLAPLPTEVAPGLPVPKVPIPKRVVKKAESLPKKPRRLGVGKSGARMSGGDEKEIYRYTVESGVSDHIVQFQLGKQKFDPQGLLTRKAVMKEVKDLENALAKLPGFEGRTYRTMDFSSTRKRGEFLSRMTKQMSQDGLHEFKSFQSTTMREEYVKSLATTDIGGRYVQITIDGRSGRDIAAFSGYDEKEVLFAAGSQFRVVNVKSNVVHLREVFAQ